MSDTKNTNGDH